MNTLTKPRVDFDTDVAEERRDADEEYDEGWFCVRTAPFPCPATGCDFVAVFMTAAHLVVVWPRIDDPLLLGAAYNAKLAGRGPSIVEYRREFGPSISQDEWARLGRPVHAQREPEAGWDDRARGRL